MEKTIYLELNGREFRMIVGALNEYTNSIYDDEEVDNLYQKLEFAETDFA